MIFLVRDTILHTSEGRGGGAAGEGSIFSLYSASAFLHRRKNVTATALYVIYRWLNRENLFKTVLKYGGYYII